MNVLGWIGGVLLAFCGAPEAYRAITSEAYDISTAFILMWGLGELLILITILKEARKSYLIFNYSANLVFILVITGRLVYNAL